MSRFAEIALTNLKEINRMKIAVPTRDGVVDDHFGHCAYYTIFTIEDGKIVNEGKIPSPEGCGCKSGIATILQGNGIKVMLAGNMGQGALNVLTAHNIKVFRGCSGDIYQLIEKYLRGEIVDSGEGCTFHECH